MRAHRSGILLLVLVGLLFISGPAAATSISGVVLYSTDGTGAPSGQPQQLWNTQGGDDYFNLYLSKTMDASSGFLNSGNGLGTSVGVNLGPGKNTLFVFGAPGENSDPTGKASLGLFFNGNNSTPGAVGVNSTNSSGTGVGAASTANTFDLSPAGLASATNPHSLRFVDGSSTAKLTSFDWRSMSLKADLVSPLDNSPNESLDFFGSFTVEVSPALEAVPEPATLLLLGSTFAGAGLAGWRRRRKSQAS